MENNNTPKSHNCGHNSKDCCEKANHSIGCTVKECSHHCGQEDYCSLSKIEVTSHEANPTVIECTDCASFQLRS